MSEQNSQDKKFLTYNQQMKLLRSKNNIVCAKTPNKSILVRSGYFNIINGYKNPFVSSVNENGEHIYIPDTSIDQIYCVKLFDEDLRSFLLKYITKIEEEVRALTGYKFDECNNDGMISWYDTSAYDERYTLQNKMGTISKAYSELSRSKLDYVKFYMDTHKRIPTWIMIKVVNFSTFIDVLHYSKIQVPHAICKLYNMMDEKGYPNVKLLIGSLHWMRKVRNSCAHNERIYCLTRSNGNRFRGNSSRILEPYLRMLRPAYTRHREQKLFDLFVYFKYYLPHREFQQFVSELKALLYDLKSKIDERAFEYIRVQMGIIDMEDIDLLVDLPKSEIEYNKFDKL